MHTGLEVTLSKSPHLPIQVTQSFLLTSESFCCPDTPLEQRDPREAPQPPQPLTPTHPVLSFLLWGPALHGRPAKRVSVHSLYASLGEQGSLALTHHRVSQGFSPGHVFCLLLWIQSHKEITLTFDFCLCVLEQTAQNGTIRELGGGWRIYSEKMTSLHFNLLPE